MTERRFQTCPHCDLIFAGEGRFCPRCKKDVTPTPPPSISRPTAAASGITRCPLCRKPIHGEATCPHCGWELVTGPSTAESPGLAPAMPKPKRSRWLTVGLPVLAALVLSAVGYLVFKLANGDDEPSGLYEGAYDIAGLTGEYDSYGVSFVIPSEFAVFAESDITGTQQASTSSGIVLLASWDPDHTIGIGWFTDPDIRDDPLSEALEAVISGAALGAGGELLDTGPIDEFPFHGSSFSARGFSLLVDGQTLGGAASVGYCNTPNRGASLFCVGVPEVQGSSADLSSTAQQDFCMNMLSEIIATLDC
jgi:hypothetical protein